MRDQIADQIAEQKAASALALARAAGSLRAATRDQIADQIAEQKAAEALALARGAGRSGPRAGYCHVTPAVTPWQAEPAPAGVSAGLLGRLPKSIHAAFSDPELSALLCGYCQAFENVELTGEKITAAFCGCCLLRLSRAPVYACACGRPRYLDPLARPGGKVCSVCHQQARNRRRRGD
jgi:hypothetical protein